MPQVRLEEADGNSILARALLEKARLANPTSDALRADVIKVEEERHFSHAGCKNAQRPAYSGRWQSGQRPSRQTQGTQGARAQNL